MLKKIALLSVLMTPCVVLGQTIEVDITSTRIQKAPFAVTVTDDSERARLEGK